MAGNRKEYQMLFQLGAQLSSSFNSTFTKAQAQLTSMQKEIQELSKYQSDISAYQKQQSALEATRQKLLTLQQQYDNIQKEIGETEGYSSALENRLLAKQQQIEKTSASIDRQTQSLQQMRDALDAAGVDVKDLENESARLGSEMEDLKQKQVEVQEAAEKMGNSGTQAIQAYQQALVASGIQDALKAIFEELQACADASMEFESALTGVDKTTNLTASELAEMSASVKDLALEIPVTTDEMLAIGEVAGQLGIAKGNILDFATTMSMLSTATTMAADEGATMLAQFANITQMDQTQYDELASAIVALGNSYATTEQKITEMSQGIAASASLAGMSEADMLGLSAAVSSLGIETQMGSTAVSKLISMLMTAVETGDGLEDLAYVAGMSANQFAEAWGNNAVGALESFVVGLSDTERLGQSAIVTLTDLGVTETRMQRTILSLSNSGDLLTRTIATANQAWDENIALSEEAAKRYATTASQQVLMENSFNNLRIAIGDNYTPALKELYGVAKDVFAGLTDFVEANPELVKAVTATVGVIGSVTAALTAYTAVVKIAGAATGLLTSVIPGVNVIMGVTAGIAALTGVVVGLSEAANENTDAVQNMTAASREDYYQLQDLKAEYESVCDAYGETSVEAQYLARQIEDINASFEENKQTADELEEETRAVLDAHRELMASFDETEYEIDREARSSANLINKLEELMQAEGKTASTKQEILTIVEMLNEAMPQLGLAYDQYADSLNMSAEAIKQVARAEVEREQNQAKHEKLKALLVEEANLYATLQENVDEATARQKEYDAAVAARKAKDAEIGLPGPSEAAGRQYAAAIMPYAEAVNKAKSALDEARAAEEAAQQAWGENQSEIESISNALSGYSEETGEATTTTAALNDRISETTAKMQELAEAYTVAYEAAYSSVSGQYSLWEEAAEVVATSASTINTAIDSQLTYWQNYNSNLQSLTDRSKDIEGLSDMIASFADGSTDSVNAVAGMATATDEELTAMVADWQALQEEQDKVATSIAELTAAFNEEMDALQTALADDIAAMNLSEEAATSGKYTIEGFIDGATDMLPQVQAAYARIAQAAMAAIDSTLDINSPSREMEYRAEMTWAGYIKQTREMEPEVMSAMSETANLGVQAVEAQALMNPVRAEAIIARSADAGNGSSQLPPIQVSITVEGDASADTAENLKAATGEVIEAVLEAIDERDQDRQRRSYS